MKANLPPHDFDECKENAEAVAAESWMEKLYRHAFPGFESMSSIRCDGWAQRGGIDRKINLLGARSVFVEEKFRFVNYGDMLLERWSNFEKRKPGWIQQRLLADFIAYVIIPKREMYLIPYLDLRRAWFCHGRQWVKEFKTIEARNRGYRTISVAVPFPVLFKALVTGMKLTWTESDERIPVVDVPQLRFDF
jgi:hypothetical protein